MITPINFKTFVSLLLALVLTSGELWGEDSIKSLEFPLDFNLPLFLKNFPETQQLQYRYHSFGNTKLKVLVTSNHLTEDSETSSAIDVRFIYSQDHQEPLDSIYPTSTQADGTLVYEINLKKAGDYLLIPTKDQQKWFVSCLSSCGRKEITVGQFVNQMSSEELAFFSEKLERFLKFRLNENESSLYLIKKIVAYLDQKKEGPFSRFPTLPPVFKLNDYRKLLSMAAGKMDRRSGNGDEVELAEQWREVVKSFESNERPEPSPISEETPHIRYGHFVSSSVSLKMVAQNNALAAVMNKLAEQKGYKLKIPIFKGKNISVSSLDEFLDALWKTNHHVEVRDERSFANFLSFTSGEKYIRWPVWFKTQVFDKKNEELIFPSPHSQFVWQITGPEINARVNFFLGISGVGFFPKFDEERPQWNGFRSKYQMTDDTLKNRTQIRQATYNAEAYLRRVRQEAKLYAEDYPADGYGFVGICNDSSSVIESAFSDVPTFYPLFRSPKLFHESRVDDKLGSALSILPNDSLPIQERVSTEDERRQFYSRMLEMVSYPYDPKLVWDEKFFQQVEKLKELSINP